MKSLKSIFALALIMLVAASCGKKDEAAAGGNGSDSTAMSDEAKAYVGKWTYSYFGEKLVLNLKADGKYEIEYYRSYNYNDPVSLAATSAGEWSLTEKEVQYEVRDKEGQPKVETENVKVLKIKPDPNLTKYTCEEDNIEYTKQSFSGMINACFEFSDGEGSIPYVSINNDGATTKIERHGNPVFEKITEATNASAQEAKAAPANGTNVTLSFEGTVAGKHVTGEINIGKETATGNYAYDGSTASMSLSGTFDPILDILSLSESYDGNKTGTWNVVYDSKAKTISGSMVNFKDKEYKVELNVK